MSSFIDQKKFCIGEIGIGEFGSWRNWNRRIWNWRNWKQLNWNRRNWTDSSVFNESIFCTRNPTQELTKGLINKFNLNNIESPNYVVLFPKLSLLEQIFASYFTDIPLNSD